MSRALQLNKAITTVNGTNVTEAVDITTLNGVCFQYIGPATETGTLTIQKTLDGTNWVDTAFTQALAGGMGLVESGAVPIMAGQVRLKIASTANSGAGRYYVLAKGF